MTALHWKYFAKASQNHLAVTLFDCQLLLQPHGETVSFQSELLHRTVFPGTRKRLGSRTKLGCMCWNLRSRSPLDTQMCPSVVSLEKCGINKARSFWSCSWGPDMQCCLFPVCILCTGWPLLCLAQGCTYICMVRRTQPGKIYVVPLKQFPRFILFMDSFQSAWKEPPFCMTFNVCLADTGLGAQNFAVWRRPTQSVTLLMHW